jgi:hypothetical protein
MQQKMENGLIFVRGSKEEDAIIKTWRMMTKDKEKGIWYAPVTKPLLENLSRNGGLIPPAKEALRKMREVQDAVDAERLKPDDKVEPMTTYPVKAKLYKHQIRAANMALMTFGIIEPPKEVDRQ